MSAPLAVLAVSVLAAVLCAAVQESSPAFALLLSLGAAAVLLARVGTAAQTVLQGVARLEGQAGGEAFACLLRCTGIALLTDYARTLCQEAGAEALGWCAGLAGRCLILAAAWPLLEEICRRIGSIAG